MQRQLPHRVLSSQARQAGLLYRGHPTGIQYIVTGSHSLP